MKRNELPEARSKEKETGVWTAWVPR